jgi:hypothetical protein
VDCLAKLVMARATTVRANDATFVDPPGGETIRGPVCPGYGPAVGDACPPAAEEDA